MVLKKPESPWPLPQDGADALALLSGFCFALTNIWLLRLQHTPASARMVAMFGGGALMAVCCALLAALTDVVSAPNLLQITGDAWALGAGLERCVFGLELCLAIWRSATERAHHRDGHDVRGGVCQRVLYGTRGIHADVARRLGWRHDCAGRIAGIAGTKRTLSLKD